MVESGAIELFSGQFLGNVTLGEVGCVYARSSENKTQDAGGAHGCPTADSIRRACNVSQRSSDEQLCGWDKDGHLSSRDEMHTIMLNDGN